MSIEVYDNFLPTEVFNSIKEYIFNGEPSPAMPWYYSPTSVFDDDGCPQFSHVCYKDSQPISYVYDIIKPVFDTLNPFALHRIKFNATPRTTNIKEKPLHVDVSGSRDSQGNFTDIPDYNICVIYFNDNDGYTYFEGGEKVQSVANRMVIFPSNVLHAGTTCTDQKTRIVLNFNYLSYE